MTKKYAVIGDIHGCFETFKSLLDKIPKEYEVLLVGDLIDRGPKSMQVVDYVIKNNIKTVSGNHEQMAIDWYENHYNKIDQTSGKHIWLLNGGTIALESYGIKIEYHPNALNKVKVIHTQESEQKLADHIEFFKTLPVLFDTDSMDDQGRNLVVSHSSVYKVFKWSQKRINEMYGTFCNHILWNRDFNIPPNTKYYNVFGHSIQENNPRIKDNYACIDTGCFYKQQGCNVLTALLWPEKQIIQQDYIG